MSRWRLPLIVLALGCGLAAWNVHTDESVSIAAWLQSWENAHPDPRVFSESDAKTIAGLQDRSRREDLRFLLISLAAGCAIAACSRRVVREAGGTLRAVLCAGALVVGAVGVAGSVRDQWQGARSGEWTLGDDALSGMAGIYAETLRDWRQLIDADHAVILIGTDSLLSNVTAWALHPRAIYPLVRSVPEQTSEDELLEAVTLMQIGADHEVRWIVDLDALAAGAAASRSALRRVDA